MACDLPVSQGLYTTCFHFGPILFVDPSPPVMLSRTASDSLQFTTVPTMATHASQACHVSCRRLLLGRRDGIPFHSCADHVHKGTFVGFVPGPLVRGRLLGDFGLTLQFNGGPPTWSGQITTSIGVGNLKAALRYQVLVLTKSLLHLKALRYVR